MEVLPSCQSVDANASGSPLAAGRIGAERAQRWLCRALEKIEADQTRTADTNLIRLELPRLYPVSIYMKDETGHPSGSLKHRLARSLFVNALCSGWINAETTIVEASSGSTAVSEAYFARLLNLPFVAVVPRGTSAEKTRIISFYGGRVHFVDDPASVYSVAAQLADEIGGRYLDQFTYAERVSDWRGNDNNIAKSIFSQMSSEAQSVPTWVVCGAGTGGTSATIGRYLRYKGLPTQLCVADPTRSVFHQYYADRRVRESRGPASCIEGIGRPRVEPSFIPSVIDLMIPVSDDESLAGAHVLSEILGKRCGGSTGTNFWAVCMLASEMAEKGETGSIVSLICDSGDRYQSTYFNPNWLAANAPGMPNVALKLKKFIDAKY